MLVLRIARDESLLALPFGEEAGGGEQGEAWGEGGESHGLGPGRGQRWRIL